MFVSDQPVPLFLPEQAELPEAERNMIFVKPKMDFGTRQLAMDDMLRLAHNDLSSALGAHNVALMRRNIVGWSGPAFAGMLCTPENIEKLDQDDPLVDLVLHEVNRRNPIRRADPKATSAGGPPLPARAKESPSAPSTSTSRLQSTTNGRKKRSTVKTPPTLTS